MNVLALTAALDSIDIRSTAARDARTHLAACVMALVTAVEADRRQLTWSERNLLASALKAMERENWPLARAYIWNAIQLDGQGRRVFGDEHRARLVKLTPERLVSALRHLCECQRLPSTFRACSPPHVPRVPA